jgi:carbamoyltransferase
MAYNILGINPGHNGSAALISDGELVYYVEEERLSRQKYDGNPFKSILDILSRWHVDVIVIGGTSSILPQLPWTGEDPYSALVRKFNPDVKVINLGHEHHLGHAACAFYNSGFDKALAVIVDGAGSLKKETMDEEGNSIEGFETESIWVCEYPSNFAIFNKVYYSDNIRTKVNNGVFDFDNSVTLTKSYEAVSEYLGFGFIEAGKTMGLAPYGKKDSSIPPLFLGNRADKNIFIPLYPKGAYIDEPRFPQFFRDGDPKDWHKDSSKLKDIEKNLAWQIQNDTQELLGNYIEYGVNSTGIKKVVVAGGFGLNCVANYYLQKRFPDIEFYFEPIAHDGGTAIGIAKLVHHKDKEDSTIRPQTTLYHGPEYNLQGIENVIKNNSDKIKTEKVSYSDVAKLISDKNIVALYQGRSEAGPRALGNRSILYDSTDPNGKDYVNMVKGREWFRPFAGSCLAEDAAEWFDLAGLEESPFMMYAVNVVFDKVAKIPSICHVDETCRVQTVTEEQNKHYYNLIKAYKEITGVPVIFNTSYNLAGDPLVETIDNALDALYRSKMKYLYLPELEILVTKTIEDPLEKQECETCDNEEHEHAVNPE